MNCPRTDATWPSRFGATQLGTLPGKSGASGLTAFLTFVTSDDVALLLFASLALTAETESSPALATYTTAPSPLNAGLRVDALTAGGLGLACLWLFAYARPRRLRVYGAESFKSNSPHS